MGFNLHALNSERVRERGTERNKRVGKGAQGEKERERERRTEGKGRKGEVERDRELVSASAQIYNDQISK